MARQHACPRPRRGPSSGLGTWEIATKHRLGKLGEAGGPVACFAELVAADSFEHLPVSYVHAMKGGGYPSAHCDPFDRMLAAQSELEGLPLATRDIAFADFKIKTLW